MLCLTWLKSASCTSVVACWCKNSTYGKKLLGYYKHIMQKNPVSLVFSVFFFSIIVKYICHNFKVYEKPQIELSWESNFRCFRLFQLIGSAESDWLNLEGASRHWFNLECHAIGLISSEPHVIGLNFLRSHAIGLFLT